ncbi:hypothetical protein ACIREO_39340 [Streptomyces sp. NPDC102441]|uniref:hypothetical protein n=1 Tax=Streptomyces sp. NPDC102441 TaxID=3366176 RepID=UPI0037FB01C7
MSGTHDGVEDALHILTGGQLRVRGAEMFMEVQRADVKAATLCAVAGGLLAVACAAPSVLPKGDSPPVAVLACSCALFGLGLIAALVAIRPVLPDGSRLTGLEGICTGTTAEDVVAAFQDMNSRDRVRVEADRLSLLASLACRKFQTLKVASDLIVAGILVAGIGLLITYLTS